MTKLIPMTFQTSFRTTDIKWPWKMESKSYQKTTNTKNVSI